MDGPFNQRKFFEEEEDRKEKLFISIWLIRDLIMVGREKTSLPLLKNVFFSLFLFANF